MERENINAIVMEEIAAAAQCYGLPEPVAQDLSRTVGDRLVFRIGGQFSYVAKRGQASIAERDARIAGAFGKEHVNDIARREGITPRRVRQIAARIAAAKGNAFVKVSR